MASDVPAPVALFTLADVLCLLPNPRLTVH